MNSNQVGCSLAHDFQWLLVDLQHISEFSKNGLKQTKNPNTFDVTKTSLIMLYFQTSEKSRSLYLDISIDIDHYFKIFKVVGLK